MKELRQKIFDKNANRCAWCGAEHDTLIYRENNKVHELPEGHEADALAEIYKVVHVKLRMAYLDHDYENTELNNLVTLCQKCHSNHEIKKRVSSSKYGRNYKINQLTLFKK